MKLIKTANGEKQLKLSKTDWENIGKQAGWLKESASIAVQPVNTEAPTATCKSCGEGTAAKHKCKKCGGALCDMCKEDGKCLECQVGESKK